MLMFGLLVLVAWKKSYQNLCHLLSFGIPAIVLKCYLKWDIQPNWPMSTLLPKQGLCINTALDIEVIWHWRSNMKKPVHIYVAVRGLISFSVNIAESAKQFFMASSFAKSKIICYVLSVIFSYFVILYLSVTLWFGVYTWLCTQTMLLIMLVSYRLWSEIITLF